MSLTDERIGHIIRLERNKKRLTLDELGKLIGLNHASVSNYESGKRRVPPERAEALAKVLGLPVKLLDRQAYTGPDSLLAVDSLEKSYGPGSVTSTTLSDALDEIERLRGLVAWSVTKFSHYRHHHTSRTLAGNLDASPDANFTPQT
jgi:transcriptional regulator with XRE-family HTH domain